MDYPALKAVISLLEQTVASHEQFTCRQLLTVLYAAEAGGMLQKDLAEKVGVSEGTISRNYKVLGPEGTGCLRKEGDQVLPDTHVVEGLKALFADL